MARDVNTLAAAHGKRLDYYPFLPVVVLIAAALAVYWPVFSNQFLLLWDDQWVPINHYTEDGLAPDNIWNVISRFYHGQYAPVNELYYIVLYNFFGYSAFWFHTAGLLIHILNVLLAYSFIFIFLSQTNRLGLQSIRRISLIVALLFAIHPFLAEAVSWVSASKVILYTFFYLIALHFYLEYISTTRYRYYALTIVFFIISFGAKEQAVTFPLCLLLLDYFLGRDCRDKKIWLEKAPIFLLSIFFGIVTIRSQSAAGVGVLSHEAKYPFYQSCLFACYSLTDYTFKCLIPVKLSYLYPFPNQVGDPVPLRFWIYPPVIIGIMLIFWNFWRQRWVLFGTAFFIIHIALALNIIPLSRYSMIADRYAYLSSVGVFFVIAWLIDLAILKKVKNIRIGLTFFALYLLSLGIYACRRSQVWHDDGSLKKELLDLLKQRNDFENNY